MTDVVLSCTPCCANYSLTGVSQKKRLKWCAVVMAPQDLKWRRLSWITGLTLVPETIVHIQSPISRSPWVLSGNESHTALKKKTLPKKH